MKVVHFLTYTCLLVLIKYTKCAAVQAPLSLITLEDLSTLDREQIEYLNGRAKRSGISSIKSLIGQTLKNKIGQIARGSASASGHFSSSSGPSYHHYHPSEGHDHKSFDFWSLKKSILNTLLQAVKAIKGGVIAIKGQLIKGSGHIISAKGKLISSKGEAITNLGKNIASSAILIPYHKPAHIEEYGHSEEHIHEPSGSDYHGSPSAPGPEYDIPDYHHSSSHEGDQSGILILKKIPHDDKKLESFEHSSGISDVPNFKPISSSGPGFATIFGKFFSASSSLDPKSPAGFSDLDFKPDHSENLGYKYNGHYSPYEDSHKDEVILDEAPPPVDHHYDDHHSNEYFSPSMIKPVVIDLSDYNKIKTASNNVDQLKSSSVKQEENIAYPPLLSTISSVKYKNNIAYSPILSTASSVKSKENIAYPPLLPAASLVKPKENIAYPPLMAAANVDYTRQNTQHQSKTGPYVTDFTKSISFELGPYGPKRLT